MTQKEMQEEFLRKNKVVHCPDSDYFSSGRIGKKNKNYQNLANKENTNHLKGIEARLFANKEKQKCKNCGDLFTPKKISVLSQVKYSVNCERCSKANNSMKIKVKKLKGWENFFKSQERIEELRGEFIKIQHIQPTDEKTIKQQIKIREELYSLTNIKAYSKGIKSLQDNIEEYPQADYEFDF